MKRGGAGNDDKREEVVAKPRPLLRSYEPNPAARQAHLPGGHFSTTGEGRHNEGTDGPQEGGAAVSEGELQRLQRAVQRLMDGQQEALDAIRLALEASETLTEVTEETLVDLEDILESALDDARAILGAGEGGEA